MLRISHRIAPGTVMTARFTSVPRKLLASEASLRSTCAVGVA
jgi:hypothetical protein